MSSFVRRFVSQGHLVDSGLLTGMLNLIIEEGADYRVVEFRLGKTNQDVSHLELELHCGTAEQLAEITAKLIDLGCYERSAPEGVFRRAPKDGCAPEDFYSSTHHRTQVFVNGTWREVSNQRMDGVIVEQGEELICKKLRDVEEGEAVLCGSESVRLLPTFRDRKSGAFGFMTNEVSSERSVEVAVQKTAEELEACKEAGQRCVVVAGPVVVHTGGAPALAALIRGGYVQGLLSGNALAGSIRDDGPLPETVKDVIEAQRRYEEILRDASLVLMLGTMLHSIAVGNMLHSAVRTICVDIQPAVITKLMDRGSAHTIGIVTDVGLYLRSLATKLIWSIGNGT
jgi:hypothetical protein